MNWLRWYHGTTRDPKWRVIAQKSGVSIPTVIAIWAALLENASESPTRGVLEGWDAEDVAACFDVTHETVVTVCNAMQQKVLDGETLTAWSKRNPIRERDDNSTDRVRRFRAKKHTETPRNAKKHPDKIRLEKSREEEKGNGNGGASAPTPDPILVFGEFSRVRLSKAEHDKLTTRLNGHAADFINQFDRWVNEAPDAKAHGVRRKDRHAYSTILAWYDRAIKEGKISVPTRARMPL